MPAARERASQGSVQSTTELYNVSVTEKREPWRCLIRVGSKDKTQTQLCGSVWREEVRRDSRGAGGRFLGELRREFRWQDGAGKVKMGFASAVPLKCPFLGVMQPHDNQPQKQLPALRFDLLGTLHPMKM